MGEKYIDEPAVKMRGEPHLDNAIRQRLLDPGDVLQHNDRIPQDLYAQWQAEMDAEIEADRMALARALLIG